MADLPFNGPIRNPVEEGKYTDPTDGDSTKNLQFPQWGFVLDDFLGVLPTRSITASTTNEIYDGVAELKAQGGGTLTIAPGTYTMNTTVNARSGTLYDARVIIQGSGVGATVLKAGNIPDASSLLHYGKAQNVVIRDMTLDANGRVIHLINIGKGLNFLAERLNVIGGRTGIYMEGVARATVRFCEVSGQYMYHGISAGDGDNSLNGAPLPTLVSVYSNYVHSAPNTNEYGIDLHVDSGEVCGNHVKDRDKPSKCPDGNEIYWHNNFFEGGNSEGGTRFYAIDQGNGFTCYFYDNHYKDHTGRGAHINEKPAGRPLVTMFYSYNTFTNITNVLVRNNGTVFVDPASTVEAGEAGVTTAPDEMLTRINDLRTFGDSGGDGGGGGGGQEPGEFPGAPYSRSTYVTDVTWEGVQTAVAIGIDSDGWASTWGLDNDLYVTYLDGKGFDSGSTSVSMGFANVSGAPPDILGTNIIGTTVPLGHGRQGKKSSGILSVSNVLYLWVRNVNGNGQQVDLWSSTDGAITWTEHTGFLPEFGYVSFINYGKDYSGAQDSYVYCVAADTASAYTPGDDFVLARVPVGSITTRGSYEFFSGTPASPAWDSNIANRAPIFTDSGRCLRHSVNWNPGISRYILWQTHFTGDVRFAGGFAMFEAEDPWGPWTTIYYTESWDMGPGERAEIPSKWLSQDGKTGWLMSSTNDELTVRKFYLETGAGQSTTEIIMKPLASLDDVEEALDDTILATGNDLNMGATEKIVGIRFPSVTLPTGKTIVSAKLRFTASKTNAESATLYFRTLTYDDAPQFTTANNDVSGRPRSTAMVTWNTIESWTAGTVYDSPSMTAIIQEIYDRAGWASGNSISVVVADNDMTGL